MWNFRRNRKREVPKYLKQKLNNPPSGKSAPTALSRAQKNIRRQAVLAGLTVVLTIVILFAMTSAWYTNIVQTGGLVFEAESWGFDGEINVPSENVTIAPGDEGIVYLEVNNDSDSITAISVNVSKTKVSDEMKKRLFFYVDTHMNREEETLERVYLNSYEGYTYTVFSQGNLLLSEQASNAPQLKWQWVYDVLGYYVLAQSVETEDGIRMNIKEYLRPIEYDYDKATITMDSTGDTPVIRINTVDGTTSLETYLALLSMKDGYEGTIDVSEKLSNNYYPVDVDENGYGVYAYLCNYTEVEQAIKYDTYLGNLAYQKSKDPSTLDQTQLDELSHEITLTISAQKNQSTAVNVSTLDNLETALQQGIADVVQLGADITIPAGKVITVPANTRVMVDMNGNSIVSASGTAIKAEPGSSLTLINGTVDGPGGADSATYGIYTTGAEVVMSDVDVSDFRYGVYLGDNVDTNSLDSRVHMVGCTVDADWYAVFINGNGLLSSQKTQLIIENSTLTSDGMVITANGTSTGNGRYGTDIQIIGSTLTQTSDQPGAAIYHPQKDSTLSIYQSTLTGYTAIALKGGEVSIVDSTITGNGIQSVTPEEFSNSGFVDTADAVYIETNYGYDIGLSISGSSVLTSNAGQSLRVFEEDATNVRVQIESGTFDQPQLDKHIAEGSAQSSENGKTVVSVQGN